MDNLLSPQLLAPVLVALISAAGTYFVIIRRTRAELAAQTKSALDVFREKTQTADIEDRVAFRAEQRADLQELRKHIKQCEIERAEVVVKLAAAQAHIMILEARVLALEQERR